MATAGSQLAPAADHGLASRVLPLVALFAVEAIVATVLLDGAARGSRDAWLTVVIHRWGAWVARCIIGFSALFATFAYLRYREPLTQLAAEAVAVPIRGALLAAHFAALAVFSASSAFVYPGTLPAFTSNLVSAVWLAAVAAAIACAALAFLPWKFWVGLARGTGWLWGFAAAAAITAGSAESIFRSWWKPASHLTFSLVQLIASPLIGTLIVDRAEMKIGTNRFAVIIADECSGLEGIGLLLVFGFVWLVVFWDDLRFPNALVMFPIGIVTIFLLNSLRITAMILIGNAGAVDVATGGFHSQAGWLVLNAVAFGLLVSARRWSWISAHPDTAPASIAEAPDATGAYLIPFLCVLAAGMVAHAASGAFEWFYGLRLAAAGVALWLFRRSYARLGWSADLTAVASGIAVFLLWVGIDRAIGAQRQEPMPAALSSASAAARYGWIAVRVLAAVVTVPIAEELAFRGYLLRRMISADFEAISLRRFTWIALAGSSILFGLMHGSRWPAGIAAGAAYALIMVRRGRIGDAIAAHATTNALLAVYVLVFHQWQFW